MISVTRSLARQVATAILAEAAPFRAEAAAEQIKTTKMCPVNKPKIKSTRISNVTRPKTGNKCATCAVEAQCNNKLTQIDKIHRKINKTTQMLMTVK